MISRDTIGHVITRGAAAGADAILVLFLIGLFAAGWWTRGWWTRRRARIRDESGQSPVEYVLIIAIVAIGILVALAWASR